jgi:hypothetical protein
MSEVEEKVITVTFSDEGAYLLVSIRGPWNIRVLEKYVLEIQERLDKLGYKRVLVDTQELTHPGESSFERYKIGVTIAREWGPFIKAAVMAKPENISGYAETAARNRGANFAVFSDMEAAKDWLLS